MNDWNSVDVCACSSELTERERCAADGANGTCVNTSPTVPTGIVLGFASTVSYGTGVRTYLV